MKTKRNPDTRLSSSALEKLAEYIASRRDLDNADPSQIEAALKKAGKIPGTGDHYYTAYHAAIKAIRIRRLASEEWENLGMCDDMYYIKRHRSCGTRIQVLAGYEARCPKCDPKGKSNQ